MTNPAGGPPFLTHEWAALTPAEQTAVREWFRGQDPDAPETGRGRPWAVGVQDHRTGTFQVHSRLPDEAATTELAGWAATDRAGVEVRYLPVGRQRPTSRSDPAT